MKKIKNIKSKLILVPAFFLLYLVMYALKTTCIIKSIFGICCPGCGMTRAILSAIKLDFAAAFVLHPMFWSLPILILYFLYDGCLFSNKKINFGVIAVLALSFLLNWIVKIVM